MINISKNIYLLIKRHAKQCFPAECCGLLVNSGDKYKIIPCQNISDDKLNSFIIAPKDYVLATKSGQIIAFYHSHTSKFHEKDFTILDKLNSINHKLPIIMYNFIDDQFKIFDESEIDYQYIGLKFQYNVNDCLSLVEKYYKNEFNIILPIYDRNENTIENNPYIFIENMEKYGFQEIDKNIELKNGDIIINNSLKGPTHLMIYVGNNQILHNKFNSYSTVELYNNLYKQYTYKIIRHKELWK